MTSIAIDGLTVRKNDVVALHDVELSVDSGSGAGRTRLVG